MVNKLSWYIWYIKCENPRPSETFMNFSEIKLTKKDPTLKERVYIDHHNSKPIPTAAPTTTTSAFVTPSLDAALPTSPLGALVPWDVVVAGELVLVVDDGRIIIWEIVVGNGRTTLTVDEGPALIALEDGTVAIVDPPPGMVRVGKVKAAQVVSKATQNDMWHILVRRVCAEAITSTVGLALTAQLIHSWRLCAVAAVHKQAVVTRLTSNVAWKGAQVAVHWVLFSVRKRGSIMWLYGILAAFVVV
ncbi:hypothetical protein BDZ97DRAFT_1798507 [Flammula alnicola]|nr:hypothetical protein BDZ97DRAFT_1798507 [Flammula alnicola]